MKISNVGYYKATLDTVPKSRVGSFGFVGMASIVICTLDFFLSSSRGLIDVVREQRDLVNILMPLQHLRSF